MISPSAKHSALTIRANKQRPSSVNKLKTKTKTSVFVLPCPAFFFFPRLTTKSKFCTEKKEKKKRYKKSNFYNTAGAWFKLCKAIGGVCLQDIRGCLKIFLIDFFLFFKGATVEDSTRCNARASVQFSLFPWGTAAFGGMALRDWSPRQPVHLRHMN